MEILGITSWGLALSLLLVIAAFAVLWRLSARNLSGWLVSAGSMIIQMAVMGAWLLWLWHGGSLVVAVLWLLFMSLAGIIGQCRRTRLRRRVIVAPMLGGLFLPVAVASLFVCGAVIDQGGTMSVRWLVPVAGMLLLEVQRVCGQGVEAYYDSLREKAQLYEFLLGNGASHREAVMPFVRTAASRCFSDFFVRFSRIGVLTAPAFVYGLLAGGCDPLRALSLFVLLALLWVPVSLMSLLLTIWLADRLSFDRMGCLRPVWIKPEKEEA